MFFVYSIAAPGATEPFYIGKSQNLPQRVCEHLRIRPGAASGPKIAALLAVDLIPVFRILKRCQNEEAAVSEELRAIASHVARGVSLVNSANEIRLAQLWMQEKTGS